ncbi:hypothetical protein ACEN2I_04580 [Flavobacterium sp. W22_SRS_FK3]|uniref:hypothetical protein n=1 Tax=Flavobacterium sp. W22_SRS_FK3 TaxID=3240275 RepID=UPI003F926526
MMIFTKDYISDIKSLNELEVLNTKSREFLIEKVNAGFEEIVTKNTNIGGSLESLFVESLKAFKSYDVNVCFTHLDFLIWYCEEHNIDKILNIEFNYEVINFYDYLKSISMISFFHIARVITFMNDSFLGEDLFKKIIYDLNESLDFSQLDGTSIEYFKMYMEELLLESKTFKVWLESNIKLCEFLK